MTTEQSGTLVFKDQAGEYYLVPQVTLEQGRVPEEHKAEVERLIAGVTDDDVRGHVVFFAAVFLLGLGTGGAITNALVPKAEQLHVPNIEFPS
jgi:hypothetical protein